MSRRTYLVAGIALVVMVILAVGLAVAQEPSGPDLPELTAAELLANVAEQAPKTRAVNGDFSWTNELLGETPLQLPERGASLWSFLQSGSGRLWLQEEGARLESQTPAGDTVLVCDGATLWIYSSAENTVTQYSLPAREDGGATTTTLPLDFSAKVKDMIEKLAPTASLDVTTDLVADREAYVLVLTPTADNTVFGSAQIAFDAEHYLPLRLEVFSANGDDPVLAAGFSRVSFEEVEPSLFTFTPPPGAEVEEKELELPEGLVDGMADGKGFDHAGEAAGALTVEEAQEEAGFTLALPEDPPLPFAGARVLPAHGERSPVVVLSYGQGFGTVTVVQTRLSEQELNEFMQSMASGAFGSDSLPDGEAQDETPTTENQLSGLAAALGTLIKPTNVGGHPAFQIDTQLGSAVAWQQGDIGVLVAGSVSPADLAAFAALVR